MNTVEPYSILNPHGVEDQCAKFTIDNLDEMFNLPDVTIVDEEYTFSLWVRSEAAGSIFVGGETVVTTNEWARHVATFTAYETNVLVGFGEIGTYYVYHPQLELGNLATDWTPAPEDVDQSIVDSADQIREVMIQQDAAILTSCEGLVLRATENLVARGEFVEYTEALSSDLSIQADAIQMDFDRLVRQTEEVDGELQTFVTRFNKYIRFDSDTAITIGSSDSEITLDIDNSGIMFSRSGIPFGWWDGVDFHTGNIVVEVNERAQLGNFAFVPRSDGSLSLLKVDDKSDFYAMRRSTSLVLYGVEPTVTDSTLAFGAEVSAELSGSTLILTSGA